VGYCPYHLQTKSEEVDIMRKYTKPVAKKVTVGTIASLMA
jgi:hypothetical protein